MALPLLPAVLSIGVVGLLLMSKDKPKPSPSPPPAPPGPAPLPLPLPPPIPTDPNALLAQAQALIAQAASNPNGVDPAQLDAVAVQLDAAQRPVEAAAVRQAAVQVRLRRGLPPIASTPTGVRPDWCPPGTTLTQLPVSVQNQKEALLNSPQAQVPNQTTVDALLRLADQIAACGAGTGFTTDVTQLRERAAFLQSFLTAQPGASNPATMGASYYGPASRHPFDPRHVRPRNPRDPRFYYTR